MAGREDLRKSRNSQTQTRPTEAEVSQMLREAERQYQECMRIADLADITERSAARYPKYSWDNPIGLVVTESSNAKLV